MRKTKNTADIVPIYSPRTSYKKIKATDEKMMADMTLNFDKLTINLLKQQFIKRDNQLDLQQFILIAKKHLKFWQVDIPNRQISLMRYLTFLFNEIDINGNGDMQWDQFTNYIIQKATVLKNLKTKADQVKQYVKSNVKPKIKIDGVIQKTQYIPDMQRIAFFQQGSNKIYFMNIETGQINSKYLQINPKKLVVNISSVKKQKNGKVGIRKKDLVIPTDVRVLDMIYLPQKKYRILLVSTSDGFVRGWKYGQSGYVIANQPDNQQEPFQHYFSSQIYCLAWDHINQVLYCGQKNGSIYLWNLKTDLQKALCCQVKTKTSVGIGNLNNNTNQKENSQQKVHMMITSMITMPKLQFMASGRMDGKIILWDTINNKKKWVYKEHTRGILTLAFNQAMILLFSAGFDHKICIWNPYISTLIHRIQGHLAPILSLRVIQGTHQLISMDSQGIVKITDTRRFSFIHSFSVETPEEGQNQPQPHVQNQNSSISSLIIINKPLKLVFAGRSIAIYQYDKNYNPHTADQYTAICCKYVKDKLCFFTPMGNKIKVWSALNGDVQRIYSDLTPNQISTFQFDFLKKRMVVGDTKGNINLHNTANGAKMKALSKHAGQITNLIATQNDSGVDIFISSGLDNEIRICKQTQQSYEIIRTIYIRKDASITCLQYCQKTKLIMVGTNVGTLAFYEIQTGKTAGTCLNKPHEQFTSICKTNQPMIIATTSTGKVNFIAIPPFPNRFEKLISFYHQDCQKLNSTIGVRSSAYSQQLQCLFIIDDKMYLTCYSLKQISKGLNFNDLKKQKTQSQRRSTLNRIFENISIKQQWQIKVHTQVVKSLQYIKNQKILITTSFDKKVKIWSAITGQFIDSLQQNYNKADSLPLAYYDTKLNILYSYDRRKSLNNIILDAQKLQFDPFVYQQTLSKYNNNNNNNHNTQNIPISKNNIEYQQELDQITIQQNKPINIKQAKSKSTSKNKNTTFNCNYLNQNDLILNNNKNQYQIFMENSSKYSNKQWKVMIDFKDVVDGQIKKFQQLAARITQNQETYKKLNPISNNFNSNSINIQDLKSKTVDLHQITKNLIQKRKILKQVNDTLNLNNNSNYASVLLAGSTYMNNNDKEQMILDQQHHLSSSNNFTDKKLSTNYFKRSLMKCVQNYVEKNQNSSFAQSMFDKQNIRKCKNNSPLGIKKSRDFIPIIQQIKKGDRNAKDIKQHKDRIQNLYRSQTQSIMNSHNNLKILMSKEQARAIGKLCKLLQKTDSRDKRPQLLYKSIQIKDGNNIQNAHSCKTLNTYKTLKGLPQI